MLPTIWFPAPLNGVGVGLVALAEGEAELEMTVKTGAEQADVGAPNLSGCPVPILYSLQRSQRAVLTVSLKQPSAMD